MSDEELSQAMREAFNPLIEASERLRRQMRELLAQMEARSHRDQARLDQEREALLGDCSFPLERIAKLERLRKH